MLEPLKRRNDYTRAAKTMIAKYGNQRIKHMRIHRQPLSAFLMAAMNVLTLGDFQRRFRNSPHDTLFHLRVDLYMENGNVISLEKNDVITFTERPSTTSSAEIMNVSLQRPLILNDVLRKTQEFMGNKYFYYQAKNNNCGDYILALFRSNGLLTPDRQAFIKQDVDDLFTKYSRKLTNTITDIAGTLNTMKGGQILSHHEYMMLDIDELTKDIRKIVEKHTKKALKMNGKGFKYPGSFKVGGDKGKPPKSVDILGTKMKGEGIQDKLLEYLTNPARISTDAGIAIAEEIGKSQGVPKEQRRESHRKTRKIAKDYVEPIGNLFLAPEVAALKSLTGPEQKALFGKGLLDDVAEVGENAVKEKKQKRGKTITKQAKQVTKTARKRENALIEDIDKKIVGSGHQPKSRLVKGSPEAIAWGQRMKELREAKKNAA